MAMQLLILLLMSTSFQYHVHASNDLYLSDPLNATISSASSTKSISNYIKQFHEASLGIYQSENMDREIGILKKYLRRRLQTILDSIIGLPSVVNYSSHKENLVVHFHNIADKYQVALRLQKQKPERFKRKVNESFVENSMSEIRRILTEDDTINFLINNFKEEIKKFQNTCTSKMSHMQLLDALLAQVQIAMGQYYTVKYLSLKISNNNSKQAFNLAGISSDIADMNQISDEEVNDLIEDIESEYGEIATEIKNIMAVASREFWACDSRIYKDDILHVGDQDSPYTELQALTLYYYLDSENELIKPNCAAIKKPKPCNATDSRYQLCENSRSCPYGFLECKETHPNLFNNVDYKTACTNVDLTAYHKYYTVFQNVLYKDNPPACKYGWSPITMFAHHGYCECLCIEKNYYFVESSVTSNYSDDNIVTSARLVVKGNFIFIKIQEAKILANGNIDKSTLQWKALEKERIMQDLIDRTHTLESVDLTEIEVPFGHVVTGLRFKRDYNGTERIKLAVLSNLYDHKNGKLNKTHSSEHEPDNATDEYKLEARDASIRSAEKNTPVSKSNQYVSFTVADLGKDGGQTTIPFIDTQKVESVQLTPLSGAGLYLRGQPGYGGFLALKLYSYNIEPYVDIGSISVNWSSMYFK